MPVRRSRIADEMRQRVVSGLRLGVLGYGERLPSVREVASELRTDPRVVLAAYRDLETEGLVELRPRSGAYVAPMERVAKETPLQWTEWLTDVLAGSLSRGVPAPEFAERARRSVETLRLRAVVLECNDDQLWSMPFELRRDYGMDAVALDLATLASSDALPTELRRADALVTTVAHASEAEALAGRIGVPSIAVTMCTELFAEVRRLLPRGSVHFVVSDPRFAAKLHCAFAESPGAENLRTHVLGAAELAEIPMSAPTYVTRLTRLRMGRDSLLDRVLPEARVFSADSSRQILSFVVQANVAAMSARGAAPPPAVPRRQRSAH